MITLASIALISVSSAAQDNSIKTVADKGVSGMYLVSLCAEGDYAIDADSAELFSIYTDMGKAFFTRLMIRGGKHYVKAGDHVIIKTTEARTVTMEASDGRSTVFYDDIICPSEDTSIEDFRASHLVGEDKYIYMLTNMERNGGFGFTYFTGTTMKKGNFYIVSTVVPEPTGIQSIKGVTATGGQLYNLLGRHIDMPTAGQIYIRGGRKFVYCGEIQTSPAAPVMTRAANDIEDGDQVPFLPGEAGNDDGF